MHIHQDDRKLIAATVCIAVLSMLCPSNLGIILYASLCIAWMFVVFVLHSADRCPAGGWKWLIFAGICSWRRPL